MLLDCGWTTKFDVDELSELKEVAPTVDIIVLSHAEVKHVGALPYALLHLTSSRQ